jgi:hypothetical protein
LKKNIRSLTLVTLATVVMWLPEFTLGSLLPFVGEDTFRVGIQLWVDSYVFSVGVDERHVLTVFLAVTTAVLWVIERTSSGDEQWSTSEIDTVGRQCLHTVAARVGLLAPLGFVLAMLRRVVGAVVAKPRRLVRAVSAELRQVVSDRQWEQPTSEWKLLARATGYLVVATALGVVLAGMTGFPRELVTATDASHWGIDYLLGAESGWKSTERFRASVSLFVPTVFVYHVVQHGSLRLRWLLVGLVGFAGLPAIHYTAPVPRAAAAAAVLLAVSATAQSIAVVTRRHGQAA